MCISLKTKRRVQGSSAVLCSESHSGAFVSSPLEAHVPVHRAHRVPSRPGLSQGKDTSGSSWARYGRLQKRSRGPPRKGQGCLEGCLVLGSSDPQPGPLFSRYASGGPLEGIMWDTEFKVLGRFGAAVVIVLGRPSPQIRGSGSEPLYPMSASLRDSSWGSSPWVSAIHVGELDGVLNSWFCLEPVLAVAGI